MSKINKFNKILHNQTYGETVAIFSVEFDEPILLKLFWKFAFSFNLLNVLKSMFFYKIIPLYKYNNRSHGSQILIVLKFACIILKAIN